MTLEDMDGDMEPISRPISMAQQTRKKEETRERLNELFINYAEFSIEKGEFFIPYTGLNRIFRESNVLSAKEMNKFSVIVKQEVNNK